MLRRLWLVIGIAAFVAGCDSDPTSTEPASTHQAEFKKGGGNPGGGENPGSSAYEYAFTGDVTTDPGGLATANVGGGDAESVVLDGCCGAVQERLTLDPSLLAQLDPGGVCFTAAEYDFAGGLQRDRKDVNRVAATFYFMAAGTDGAEQKYVLSLDGEVGFTTDGDIFPPEVGETTSISFESGTMETEGKGKGADGKACIGNVTLNAQVDLTGTG